MLVPKLPKEGDTVRLFGIEWLVEVVEPASDWAWHIELVNHSGETAELTIPTDERTV